MADDKKTAPVIKKVKKMHGGAHGGSWKVAYADFVTAMMAFFLLLWLLAMVSPEKRIVLAEYFKEFSIFKDAGVSFMAGSRGAVQQPGGELKMEQKETKSGSSPELTAEEMKEKISASVDQKMEKLKDQVVLDVVEGGLRIQLVDKEGSRMFESGSTEPTARAKELISIIAGNIRETTNRIAVEGHTDAAPYAVGNQTNWEVSTNRASAARRELEANGIDPYRIARVVGYADTEPLIKYNPRDERNRRISLILLYEKRKEEPTLRAPELESNSPAEPPPPGSP
ncbi:MAG: OmpA family protein [Nitrospinae bacterium]|nr:OmpA family protein [Nitrospinota bacterium]